jgi:hypothetical protein
MPPEQLPVPCPEDVASNSHYGFSSFPYVDGYDAIDNIIHDGEID